MNEKVECMTMGHLDCHKRKRIDGLGGYQIIIVHNVYGKRYEEIIYEGKDRF